jgi:hypothetical protein
VHKRPRNRLGSLGALALALGALAVAPSLAPAKGPHICSGTLKSFGVISGDYPSGVVVKGACEVNAGPAHVFGTLTLWPGSVLAAAFGLNARTHHGGSSLTVTGDVLVGRGATFVLGCNPKSSPCFDDPHPKKPTLTSAGRVSGNLTATAPLGVLVHTSKIGGNVEQTGGGGGLSCAPPKRGPFSLVMSPVFSAYEDSSVGGNLAVTGVRSCWLGVARVHVGGNLRFIKDNLGDPDGIEIIKNDIRKDLVCRQNSAVWDSVEVSMTTLFPRKATPNKVHGKRVGQCRLSSRSTPGGKPGPGPF